MESWIGLPIQAAHSIVHIKTACNKRSKSKNKVLVIHDDDADVHT